jgi:aldose 1-epimerase
MKNLRISLVTVLILQVVAACTSSTGDTAGNLLMERDAFQKERNGKEVDLYTLENNAGSMVQITNYGGKIVSIICPDKNGDPGDVCLGYESLDDYVNGAASLGATMGPYANRIANAQFELDGTIYTLDKNNGEHTIHGGSAAFRSRVWDVKSVKEDELILSILSEDGAGGFPGNLRLTVSYLLSEDNELKIQYHASTDKKTVVNFTNHAFFNLAGEGSGDILGHKLLVKSDSMTPVDATGIPTGEIVPVEDSPFDFRSSKTLGRDIKMDHVQLKHMGGYDHNYVLNTSPLDASLVAILQDPVSGRLMEVYTTEPGLQVYTANSLNTTGKGGKEYGPWSSVCLETQHFPDSPHHPHFPSSILEPGKDYTSTTIYKFGIADE